MLHSDSFRLMASLLQRAAQDLCGGRLLMAHEGGYSKEYGTVSLTPSLSPRSDPYQCPSAAWRCWRPSA